MYGELKRQCFDGNMLLPKLGLVIYTFGNVSCADHERGCFAIKPSGIDYETLSPADIVIVGFDGRVLDGKLRPSSDTNTHLELYRNWPKLGAIVHTHSAYAVAWAQACRDVPLYGTTHADHLAADIPCTDLMADERIEHDYEIETGFQIIDRFRAGNLDPVEIPMVLVAGHGPFAWGKDAAEAVYRAKVLEELCRMALLTEQVNPGIGRLKRSLIEKHYFRKHGKNAYYGQN